VAVVNVSKPQLAPNSFIVLVSDVAAERNVDAEPRRSHGSH
jgi:hypothetical protein